MKKHWLMLSLISVLMMTGCAITAPQRFEPLPVEDSLLNPSIIDNIRRFDGPSFQTAECQYGMHTIPCGNYLLSRLAIALNDHPLVERVTLRHFDTTCQVQVRNLLVPDTDCIVQMTAQIQVEGDSFDLSTSSTCIQKNHYAIGTAIQIVPPVPWNYPADPAYNQIREALKQSSKDFSDGLRSKGW